MHIDMDKDQQLEPAKGKLRKGCNEWETEKYRNIRVHKYIVGERKLLKQMIAVFEWGGNEEEEISWYMDSGIR